MTDTQFLITIVLMGLAVQITRFTPFIMFGNLKKIPPMVEYLGKVLPAAMMGLLVVYCYKDLNYSDFTSLLPSIVATVSIVILHLWKRNTILSIGIGTAIYMLMLSQI